ncbi:hypothetical protein CYMTET_43868 [Cymbomonas tetramitiformis]|uniref:Uncharacterized protein n=1 Tax=Cymbomonas tetramitiformis TaxID=36881 RepID=A0AAE0C394_9CHLO|nr:hypothetical protein CYMTET_43868 [Cymbomonas tetramitiformis]
MSNASLNLSDLPDNPSSKSSTASLDAAKSLEDHESQFSCLLAQHADIIVMLSDIWPPCGSSPSDLEPLTDRDYLAELEVSLALRCLRVEAVNVLVDAALDSKGTRLTSIAMGHAAVLQALLVAHDQHLSSRLLATRGRNGAEAIATRPADGAEAIATRPADGTASAASQAPLAPSSAPCREGSCTSPILPLCAALVERYALEGCERDCFNALVSIQAGSSSVVKRFFGGDHTKRSERLMEACGMSSFELAEFQGEKRRHVQDGVVVVKSTFDEDTELSLDHDVLRALLRRPLSLDQRLHLAHTDLKGLLGDAGALCSAAAAAAAASSRAEPEGRQGTEHDDISGTDFIAALLAGPHAGQATSEDREQGEDTAPLHTAALLEGTVTPDDNHEGQLAQGGSIEGGEEGAPQVSLQAVSAVSRDAVEEEEAQPYDGGSIANLDYLEDRFQALVQTIKVVRATRAQDLTDAGETKQNNWWDVGGGKAKGVNKCQVKNHPTLIISGRLNSYPLRGTMRHPKLLTH